MNTIKKMKKLLIVFMVFAISLVTFPNTKDTYAVGVNMPLLGQIALFAFPYAPRGWVECNGQELFIAQNNALYSLIGTKFGGNGKTTFALPNLQNSSPLDKAKYYIALQGLYPTFDEGSAENLVGEVCMLPYNRTPSGWSLCDGRSLAISSYQQLYSLIGISYNGDRQKFNLPDLRGIEPIENMNYFICVDGYYPTEGAIDEFLGSIDLFAFSADRISNNALECNGQLLEISQYEPLYSLIGKNYGGDGNKFKLPDLTGVVPLPQMHYSTPGSGLYPTR